jgi:hypothetical protein
MEAAANEVFSDTRGWQPPPVNTIIDSLSFNGQLCIAFKQPLSEAGNTALSMPHYRGLDVKSRDLVLVKKVCGDDDWLRCAINPTALKNETLSVSLLVKGTR